MEVATTTPDSTGNSAPGDENPADLAERARDGDARAFESLYRRHAGHVFAVCVRILADRSAAEDCTQEAFVLAWKALPRFRGASSFGTWLTRIAINAALQRLKLDRRYLQLVLPDSGKLMELEPAPAEAPDTDADMEKLIATLPPAARAVFVLF
ncbi:MAG: RNA polymerase sigma factor, partial [Gammaproteobacteria bacterium]